VIGAALAPTIDWRALLWTLLAFFLAMGISAHALDLLQGDPLKTRIPRLHLWLLACISIAGAIAIGAVVGIRETWTVIPCILFGGFIVFAYNLELFGGFFHHDIWFGAAWGAFPAVTAYIAQTHTVSWEIGLVAVACLLYSLAQRVLSRQSRLFRRKVSGLQGHYFDIGGQPVVPGIEVREGRHTLKTEDIIGPADQALKLMTWTIIIMAIGILIAKI